MVKLSYKDLWERITLMRVFSNGVGRKRKFLRIRRNLEKAFPATEKHYFSERAYLSCVRGLTHPSLQPYTSHNRLSAMHIECKMREEFGDN